MFGSESGRAVLESAPPKYSQHDPFSGARGTIPRFGEAVIEVPVTMSAMRVALQAYSLMRGGKAPEKLKYKLKGKLGGAGFGFTTFATEGEFDLSTFPNETRALVAP